MAKRARSIAVVPRPQRSRPSKVRARRGRRDARGRGKRQGPGSGAWLFRLAHDRAGRSFWVEWCQEIPDLAISRRQHHKRGRQATCRNVGNPPPLASLECTPWVRRQKSGRASSEARLDLQPALQGQRHGRALGDLGHALLLLVVGAVDGEDALDVLLLALADEAHVGVHRRHRPLLALGIHAQGDHGAGGERRRQQVVGTRPDIPAAQRRAFVGGELMMPGRDRGLVVHRADARMGVRHDVPPYATRRMKASPSPRAFTSPITTPSMRPTASGGTAAKSPPAVCGSNSNGSLRWCARKFSGCSELAKPPANSSTAPSSAGSASSARSTATGPLARIISARCPASPKPVTSVQACAPAATSASAVLPDGRLIEASALSIHVPRAAPRTAAAKITPVPSGLLSTSLSPATRPPLRNARAFSTRPFTEKPSAISGPSPEWPPISAQ